MLFILTVYVKYVCCQNERELASTSRAIPQLSQYAVRGGERSVRVRAGYCAVPDFAESAMDASELLLRATTALRDLKREGPEGERVRAFDQVTVRYPT